MSNIGYLIHHQGRLCVLEMDAFCLPPEPPYLSGCVWPVSEPTTRAHIDRFLGIVPEYGGKWMYGLCFAMSDHWEFKRNFLYVTANDEGRKVSIGSFRIDYPKPPNRSETPLHWSNGNWKKNGKPIYTHVLLDDSGNITFERVVADRWVIYHTIPLKDVLK